MFSDHNRNKLEINTGMMSGKSSNIWKQNNTILSKLCIKKKKKLRYKVFWTECKWKCYVAKFVRCGTWKTIYGTKGLY